jgi:hypothetical protein
MLAYCGKVAESGKLPGQIMVDPDNRMWLVYNRDEDGDGRLDPFFMCGPGDPEGFLYRGKRNPDGTRMGDQKALIDKLIQYGGNCIYLIAVRTHGGDAWKSARDFPEIYPDDKHNPWINQNPANGLSDVILDQWEAWFALMDRHGIVIYFFFYDDAIKIAKEFGWNLDPGGNLHPEEKRFVEKLVNRFKHHQHLIWCVMEEGQELGPNWQLHVSKIAQAIRAADDNQHVIASHQLAGNVFYHANDPNIDQFAIQTPLNRVPTPDDLHRWMLEALDKAKGRYNLNMSEDAVQGNVSVPNRNRTEIRRRNWAAAMAGAYAMVLGMNIDDTPDTWLQDCRTLQSFFESTTFNRMHPDDSLACQETEYVLSNAPFDHILYSANALQNLGLKDIRKGTYSLMWLDCTSGEREHLENLDVQSGRQFWEKPVDFGSEVALYMRRTDKTMPLSERSIENYDSGDRQSITNLAPLIEFKSVVAARDTTKYIQLLFDDPDGGPGPYTILIVSQPEHGQLTGVGNDRLYTPEKGYVGKDHFSWKVNDGRDDSRIADVDIEVR